MKKFLPSFLAFIGIALLSTAPALAAGQPVDWGLGLQEAGSPSKEQIIDFHNLLLYIIFGIAAFVLLLLVYVVLRYNRHVNKNPSKVTHNLMLEIVWTVIPIIILAVIVVPSFRLLYYTDRIENPDMTLKVTGYQWYWGYEYPDHEGINFLSYMIPDEDIDPSKGQVRLLSTDNPVVLPINKNIQILTYGGDVLHSFAVPALGVKMDTVPGRVNETWFRITKPGIYYGQCSELCGKNHAYMPIEIHAVTEEEFNAWVEQAKEEFASNDNNDDLPTRLAALEEK